MRLHLCDVCEAKIEEKSWVVRMVNPNAMQERVDVDLCESCASAVTTRGLAQVLKDWKK